MNAPLQCLALDIGGVFHGDSWETIFRQGLAEHCGIDVPTAMTLGAAIWQDHGHRNSNEKDYWQDWADRLDRHVDTDLAHALIASHVWVDRSVRDVVHYCAENGIAVCIVSNNTRFWYAQEMQRAGLEPYLRPYKERICPATLACAEGAQATGGLARLAADRDPATTLFVDDRADNIAQGRCARYAYGTVPTPCRYALGRCAAAAIAGLKAKGTLAFQPVIRYG